MARRQDGVAADCLLAVLGRGDDGESDDYARAFTGALLVVETLRILREAHTKKE
jgi:hypothetical protein